MILNERVLKRGYPTAVLEKAKPALPPSMAVLDPRIPFSFERFIICDKYALRPYTTIEYVRISILVSSFLDQEFVSVLSELSVYSRTFSPPFKFFLSSSQIDLS